MHWPLCIRSNAASMLCQEYRTRRLLTNGICRRFRQVVMDRRHMGTRAPLVRLLTRKD